VGRGELGFVMAQSARESGLISEKPYVACIWALLVATVASPMVLKKALVRWKNADEHLKQEEGNEAIEVQL